MGTQGLGSSTISAVNCAELICLGSLELPGGLTSPRKAFTEMDEHQQQMDVLARSSSGTQECGVPSLLIILINYVFAPKPFPSVRLRCNDPGTAQPLPQPSHSTEKEIKTIRNKGSVIGQSAEGVLMPRDRQEDRLDPRVPPGPPQELPELGLGQLPVEM